MPGTVLLLLIALSISNCPPSLLQVYSLTGQNVLVAASLCVFGVFALAQIPACMELGVEITYPVAESISSGLLWSAA